MHPEPGRTRNWPALAAVIDREPYHMIVVDHLTCDFPGVRALDNICATMAAGTVTALVGPNGAGKSTLLRALASLQRPHHGRVTIAGIDTAADPRGVRRHIGYLADSFGLHGRLTVAQSLRHAGMLHGMPHRSLAGATARVTRLLRIDDLLSFTCATLSRGQRQRVALAQVLLHGPALLLLDEPASGLDPAARHDLAGLLRGLGAEGATIVVSSHILSELGRYSTHVLALRDGRVHLHQALVDGPAGPTAVVRIRSAGDANALRADLVERLGPHAVLPPDPADPARVRVRTSAEPATQAALLTAVVGAGHPIAAFAAEHAGLEDRYLDSLAAAAPAGPRPDLRR